MIPDKIQFAKPQRATLVVQQTQTQLLTALDFANPGLRYEINPNAQTVSVSLPGLQRQGVKIMGAGAATPYKDGHTEEDRRAALLAQLGLVLSAPSAA